MLLEGECCSLYFPSLICVSPGPLLLLAGHCRGECPSTSQKERCPRSLHAVSAPQAVPDREESVSSSDG